MRLTRTEATAALRSKLLPDHLIGEVLSKRWVDNAIPFGALLLCIVLFSSIVPDFVSMSTVGELARQSSEFGLLALGMSIVVIGGGIDLSIGSLFALTVLACLLQMNVMGWSMWISIPGTLLVGALCGAINGYLVGYLRLRAFLTTLVTLVIYRSIYELIFPRFASAIVANTPDSSAWDFLGAGGFFGVPLSLIIAASIAIVWHIVLSRMRPGWQLMAVGGARRSAHNAGVNVAKTVMMTYVWSGVMCAIAAVLFSARLGSTGSDTGIGQEIGVLTAVVLGGVSLGGGRGSVTKALIGTLIVLCISNSMLRLNVPGSISQIILGSVLIVAVFTDVRWVKNRQRILGRLYVSPTFLALPENPAASQDSSAYALNSKLNNVELIGLNEIEGPEDVILDEQGNLYCGNRFGDIVCFEGPDFKKQRILAHIGGHPLGLAFDKDGNIVTCVGGMGVYRVSMQGEISKVTDETNRSTFSIIDDSRLRLPDDLDIGPDGKIYFSEATTRYEMSSWATDALEGRGNGRIICYDPKTNTTKTILRHLVFPNGICVEPGGESLLFAETWACRISRLFISGPREGQVEAVIENLPGYPDNLNRASDGSYWLALLGMRTDSLDLAMRMPDFRKRMARKVAPDQWLFPNINTGCVVKFTKTGKVVDVLWDSEGLNHPMITSMREHKGYLYLGGISNNRIGRYKLETGNPNWTGTGSYWGGSPNA